MVRTWNLYHGYPLLFIDWVTWLIFNLQIRKWFWWRHQKLKMLSSVTFFDKETYFRKIHRLTKSYSVKSAQIRSFPGPYFPAFGLNTGKYGPEKTPYLDIFHAVSLNWEIKKLFYDVKKSVFKVWPLFKRSHLRIPRSYRRLRSPSVH